MVDIIDGFVKVVSFLILGVIIFRIITTYIEWFQNNRYPQETYKAKVVAKRTHLFGVQVARTNYFITFEWSEEVRKEFRVPAEVYDLLTQGDSGSITFQGTRFLGFERL